MSILVDDLRRGVKVHGRARNKYELCRCSTSERTTRGLADLHDFVQDLENEHSGWDDRDKPGVPYWFSFVNGLPCYHLSRPKRELALKRGAQAVDYAEFAARCTWDDEDLEQLTERHHERH